MGRHYKQSRLEFSDTLVSELLSELLYGVVIYNQKGEVIDPTKINLEEWDYESIDIKCNMFNGTINNPEELKFILTTI